MAISAALESLIEKCTSVHRVHLPCHVNTDFYEYYMGQMKKSKFKMLGNGCFGSAWAKKDSNVVFKIGNARATDGYFNWIVEVYSTGTAKCNPMLPRIHEIRVVEFVDDTGSVRGYVYIAVMERLESLVGYGNYWDSRKPQHPLYTHFLRVQRAMLDLFNYGAYGTSYTPSASELEMMQLVIKIAGVTGRHLDFHDGNVMVRRGNQLVVTDPLGF
jgi:hypothetical protein